jgi:hypothetical protein
MNVPHGELDQTVIVDGFIATAADDTDLQQEVWSFALDQRAFGPRRLVVTFTDRAGRLLSLAHTLRTDPPELAFDCCAEYLGAGAAAAVAFCDEPVELGPPSSEVVERFARAQAIAACHQLHLVDWIECDDLMFRSVRLSQDPSLPWWNVP